MQEKSDLLKVETKKTEYTAVMSFSRPCSANNLSDWLRASSQVLRSTNLYKVIAADLSLKPESKICIDKFI